MLPIIVLEFLTKVGLSVEDQLVKLLPKTKALILDEFSHVRRCFLLFRQKQGLRASVLNVRMFSFPASSLTQSLLRSCRSEHGPEQQEHAV